MRVQKDGMRLTVSIGGNAPEIKAYACEQFFDHLEAMCLHSSCTALALDFHGAGNLNAVAVRCLHRIRQRLQLRGKDLVVLRCSPRIKSILLIGDLGEILED